MQLNIQPEYTAVDLIADISANLANSFKFARNGYQEDSEEFNFLMNATIGLARILHELLESQGSTNKHSRNNGFLKAMRELNKELNNRLMASSVVQKTNKTTDRHLRLV